MFRDDQQAAQCCFALLAQVGLAHLWTPGGPTLEAVRLLDADQGSLSSGERVVLLAAFAFWNGHRGATLADIVATLDLELVEAITQLVVAVKLGAAAVQEWLEVYGAGVTPSVH